MKYIVIDGPNGIRKVPERSEYRLEPGERPIGFEGHDAPKPVKVWLLDKLAGYFGMATADFIFFAAKALGIPHCPVCEMRYKILNAIEELGFLQAVRLIYKTISYQELSESETQKIEQAFKEHGQETK